MRFYAAISPAARRLLSALLAREQIRSRPASLHRRRAKPPGHMGPPFVMGLSARREKSSISPDTAKVRYKLAESGFFELAGHMHYRWYSKKGIETKL